MTDTSLTARVRFGVFDLDLHTGELRRQGLRVKLHQQPFQVLAILLENPGQLVTREQLRQRLWPEDTFVDFDVGLNSAVSRLREALGDSAEAPRYIETLPRRGYRFIGALQTVAPSPTGAPRQSHTRLPLRASWPAAAALVLLAGWSVYYFWIRPALAPAENRVMLAVLPFENLTGDPGREYFNDGFTEELISSLGNYHPAQLGVIARTSAMRYKGTLKSIAEIGRELGVDFVLEGSVRRDSDRVRITAQLIRVQDQTHLWAKNYDRELREILLLQSEVAADIASRVHVTLAPRPPGPAQARQSVNPDAYEAYLRGLFFWQKRTKDNLEKAIEYFQEALRLDPAYAMAYAGLARTYTVHTGLGFAPTPEGAARAEKAALQALELQPNLGEAYASLGWVYLTRWEWATAERTYQRAIELSPNEPFAHLWYGHYLLRVGRYQESLLQRQRAHELDPLDITVNESLALNLYRVGRAKEALELFQKTQVLYPDASGLASYYFLEKDYAQSRREFEQAVQRCRRCPPMLARLGHVAALTGDRKQSAAILNELKARSLQEFISPYHLAVVQAGLGNLDQAFKQLEQAYQARDFSLFSLREDAFLRPLRSDPRYLAMLRRMNFPDSPAN
jgi:TolB-like protein/DNA-binding winged helix-turn-helix (wHTH) protein/Tfp pilus assembly protein PilF